MTESRNKWSVWTTCDVSFTPYPTEQYDLDGVFDVLTEHYYERPAWLGRFIAPCLAWDPADGFRVDGLPWWMPRWWARRELVRLFVGMGVAGHATTRTTTKSLEPWHRD